MRYDAGRTKKALSLNKGIGPFDFHPRTLVQKASILQRPSDEVRGESGFRLFLPFKIFLLYF